MDRKVDSAEQVEAEFDRNIRLDDDSEAKALLAAAARSTSVALTHLPSTFYVFIPMVAKS